MKQCHKCGELKPLDQFFKSARHRDGVLNSCKPCHMTQVHALQARNPERFDQIKREAAARYRRKRGIRPLQPVGATDEGRICSLCRVFKPWDAFSINRAGPHGRASRCRPCVPSPERRRRPGPQTRPTPSVKLCTRCGVTKPAADFNKHPLTADRLQARCKPCAAEQHRQWRTGNPEKHAEAHRQAMRRYLNRKKGTQ